MSIDRRCILLTGGAGYIGSHTFVALHEAGFAPVILDDFSNSDRRVLERLRQLTGASPMVQEANVLDTGVVEALLRQHRPVGVVHFAGFKAVGESVAQPLKYFQNNVAGSLSLLRAMQAVYPSQPPALVFSSTATVYGDPASVPVTEDFPTHPESPYAQSKLMVEDMLQALQRAQPAWRIGILRYFNPVGAHPSGLIGEDPKGIPNNLMPFVTQVAVGLQPHLNVFGADYPTSDGTGVRDYIHVHDLAAGHVAALRHLLAGQAGFTLNLGTGRGYSVLEVIRAFEQASGRKIPHQVVARRPGDVAQYYADASLARRILGWQAQKSLEDMCADAWRWQSMNPQGYAKD